MTAYDLEDNKRQGVGGMCGQTIKIKYHARINCNIYDWAAENTVPFLLSAKPRYTELGTETNLETLTLFVRPPTAVSVGGRRPYKKG